MNGLDLFGSEGGQSSVIHVLPDDIQSCKVSQVLKVTSVVLYMYTFVILCACQWQISCVVAKLLHSELDSGHHL